MAKRTRDVYNGRGLFDEQIHAQERKLRRQRALFIPHFLRDAAANKQLEGPERDRACAIVHRWAIHFLRPSEVIHEDHAGGRPGLNIYLEST